MKKIVYIISTLKRTGPTNILAGTALNLDKKLFKPAVITLSPEEDEQNSWKPELEKAGIEVRCLNLSRLKGFLYGGRALKRAAAELNPDIVHTHCFRSAVFSALYLGQYKRIASVHCDYEVDFALAYGKIKGFVMSKIFKRALSAADKRVCCSEMLKALFRRKYPKTEYLYVNNGVDVQKFAPADDKSALRRSLGLPEDKKIFIWAGVFIPRKDILSFAKALPELKEEDSFFILCGDGPMLKQTEDLLKGRGNVLFAGHVNNVQDYFKAADFYVSTSLSESFHLTVYEAMACGAPVILSDIEAYCNLKGSKAAAFFEPGDYKALSAQMFRALDGGFKDCGDTAVNTVRQSYTLQTMAKGYQDIYLSL